MTVTNNTSLTLRVRLEIAESKHLAEPVPLTAFPSSLGSNAADVFAASYHNLALLGSHWVFFMAYEAPTPRVERSLRLFLYNCGLHSVRTNDAWRRIEIPGAVKPSDME